MATQASTGPYCFVTKKVYGCFINMAEKNFVADFDKNKMADLGGEFNFFRDIHITKC